MNQLKLSILGAILALSDFCYADSNIFHLNKLNFCKITEKANNDYEPEAFLSTNNLLRKTGQRPNYYGEKIIVHGRVLDQNCVPVADAKVYMWQANCKGKYPYKVLRDRVDTNLIEIDDNSTFTGNGTATTNNLGEFYFLTVYPAPVDQLDPLVNIKVEDRALGNIQTKFLLKNNKVIDPELNLDLSIISEIATHENISIFDFDIVLPGEVMRSF